MINQALTVALSVGAPACGWLAAAALARLAQVVECEMCGMFFDAADQQLHRMRYCQGSALHQAMLATREENRGAVAARLEEDPLHLLNTNLASLGQEVDGISVGELRARIAKEATERKAQREARDAAIARAEARMTEQRAKAESQRLGSRSWKHIG